jgi:hypothetical protein
MKIPEILESFKGVSGGNAKRIVSILNAVDKPEDVDGALEEVSEIIGGHGVEGLPVEGAWVDHYWRDSIALYVNMGDPYVTTIMYDTDRGVFEIGAWGDFLEDWERKQAEGEEAGASIEEEEIE